MTLPSTDQPFPLFAAGEQRDEMLASFRNGLRKLINPKTGQLFTETEILIATAPQSLHYNRFNALDMALMAAQARAQWLADQILHGRASTEWLERHAAARDLKRLPADGGSGSISVPCESNTTFIGSTTVPDPAAHTFRAKVTGFRYQVLYTKKSSGGGAPVTLIVKCIDTGPDTNLVIGDKLEKLSGPVTVTGDATVTADFRGGVEIMTEAELAELCWDHDKYRPGGGNNAQFMEWARKATNGVSRAFVYACAYHAGTTHVCVLGRRTTPGPTGKIASVGTVATVVAYLTPPASPVVPEQVHVVVTTAQQKPTDLVLTLDMAARSSAGWTDLVPWPEQVAGTPAVITTVTTQTSFRITVNAACPTPPTGATPSLMVWNRDTSRWEKLKVLAVVQFDADEYTVTLSEAASFTIAVDDYVSPDTERRDLLAETIEAYADSLGPGELVASNDERAHRAFRFPPPSDGYPTKMGSDVIAWIADASAGTVSNGALTYQSETTPEVPTNMADGPEQMTLDRVAIYAR